MSWTRWKWHISRFSEAEMSAKIWLWVGIAMMAAGVLDAYTVRGAGVIFPIGATVAFFAIRKIEASVNANSPATCKNEQISAQK